MDQNEQQLTVSDLLNFGKSNLWLLNDWEKNFLLDAEKAFHFKQAVSIKQENCLRKIVEKINLELEKALAFSSHQISHFKKLRGLV